MARSAADSQNPPWKPAVASPVKLMSWNPSNWLRAVAPILSSTALRNTGVDRRMNARIVVTRSESWYCRTAFQKPSSTPSTSPTIEPTRSSRRLTATRVPNSSLIDLFVMLWPRSPDRVPTAQAP